MLKANTKLIFFFLIFSSVSYLILTCRNYADYSAYYGILLTQSINILDVKSIKMFALQRQKKKEIEGSGAKQTFTETLSRPLQIWINSGTEHMFVHYTPVLSYSRTHKEVTTKIFLNTDNRLIRTYSAEILFITRHCCSWVQTKNDTNTKNIQEYRFVIHIRYICFNTDDINRFDLNIYSALRQNWKYNTFTIVMFIFWLSLMNNRLNGSLDLGATTHR